jgi:hypothetical protein
MKCFYFYVVVGLLLLCLQNQRLLRVFQSVIYNF